MFLKVEIQCFLFPIQQKTQIQETSTFVSILKVWTCLLTRVERRYRHLLCRRQSDVLCFVLAVMTICLVCGNTALELQIAFKNTFTVQCPMLRYITLYYISIAGKSAFITDNIANYFQLENDNVCIKTNSIKINFDQRGFYSCLHQSINL